MTVDVEPAPRPGRGLLPDPERRERRFTVISADDHVVEPAHLFEGRMPQRYADRTPRVVETGDGREAWRVDDQLLANIGFNALAGRDRASGNLDPINFADMRRGAWDIHGRIADMDLDGIYASLCFPSFLAGFGGLRLQTLTRDRDFALALVRAWNDWHLEEWAGTYPDRIIPLQLPWLHDIELGAEEIRRNAGRGFRAVTFPESPHEAGFPSLHSGHWDPFIAACAETDTVVCVHTGSSGKLPALADDAPLDVSPALFGAGYSLSTTVDWLFSRLPVKYPDLKVVITEGGIGWVPSLLDRLEHSYNIFGDLHNLWVGSDLLPWEVLQRNFWFCLLDERSAMVHLDRIGVDHVLFETDYPHADASWPDSQAMLDRHMRDLPADVVERVSWRNAADLFRLAVPLEVQRDPNTF